MEGLDLTNNSNFVERFIGAGIFGGTLLRVVSVFWCGVLNDGIFSHWGHKLSLVNVFSLFLSLCC